MTERRPHWDDDLIDAVFKALSYTYLAQGWAGGIAIDLDESVYPLIAAVEDWQAKNYVWASMIDKLSFRAETAEARVEYLEAKLAGFDTTY